MLLACELLRLPIAVYTSVAGNEGHQAHPVHMVGNTLRRLDTFPHPSGALEELQENLGDQLKAGL